MSTSEPPTSADRVLARHGRGPSGVLQATVLLLGAAGAAVIATVLTTVTQQSNPIWILPVIASGFVVFLGLLATGSWAARATLRLGGPTVVGGARYLVVVLLVGGLVVLVRSDGRPGTGVGIGLLAGAALFALMTIHRGVRRRRNVRSTARLREGHPVVGVVTDDGLAEFPDSPNPKLVSVVVKFRDLQGTDRWVTRRATQVPGGLITVGTEVDVWFDPADPGEVRKIHVEHDNGISRILG